jgi:hypothetical protein
MKANPKEYGISFPDVRKIIEHESERLNKLAQEQGDPMKDDNVAGYIVGLGQLKANLDILLGNRQSANQDVAICWKCANVLETDDGTDHSGDPVKVCCECGAFIRD